MLTDRSIPRYFVLVLLTLAAAGFGGECSAAAQQDKRQIDRFDRKMLTDNYYSEGISGGDIDGDGVVDIVYGPYWFAGPDFKAKHEIYPAKPQPKEGYADNFFSWVYDFNGDGRNDVLVAGFPGTPAYVYENPPTGERDRPWKRHQVFDWVSNESPHFVDLVGDERPELVCTREGMFGYATVDWNEPLAAWKFHPISEKIAPERFGHGLGVGDVNGDGRADVIFSGGWFQQPASEPDAGRWKLHQQKFSDSYGGAEMHAYDVDGDGDNDVVTSLAAHDFGLAWYEQIRNGDNVRFQQHLIVGSRPEQNRYGLVFSEPHSVALADVDGDGLKDIVTGKTYYSHHRQSPMWDAGAVVYWFKLQRDKDGVRWIPYRADDTAGIGRQVRVLDINGDKLSDILCGGMKGAHVLIHQCRPVSEDQWKRAQPKVYVPPPRAEISRKPLPIDPKTGAVAGVLEGEGLKITSKTAGDARSQDMKNFTQGAWSGQSQLFWRGAKPKDRLQLELPVKETGSYAVQVAMTMARDYALVQFHLDGRPLGKPMDLFNYPDVVHTGFVTLGEATLKEGPHELQVEILGANPSAAKAYMVGIDCVRLVNEADAASK